MSVDTARSSFEVVDGGSGAPLVLAHAFPFGAEMWRDDATALAGDVRVIAPSMRGFGATPLGASPQVTVDSMADDLAAVLDEMEVRAPVVVGGLSMGGHVALAFVRRHPNRVRGVVLADTRAEPDSDEARANREVAIAKVEGGDLAGFVDGMLPKVLGRSTQEEKPALVTKVRAAMMASLPEAVIRTLRALRDRPDARPGLTSITVPALVIVGEEDALMPPSVAQDLKEGLPDAELCIVPKAGHLSNLENPEAFRAALRAFVGRLGRAT